MLHTPRPVTLVLQSLDLFDKTGYNLVTTQTTLSHFELNEEFHVCLTVFHLCVVFIEDLISESYDQVSLSLNLEIHLVLSHHH